MRKIGKMVSGAAVLLMLAAACGGKEGRGADFSEGKNRDIEVIDIDKAKREKALLYSSILEEPDVIVLETNPECIIQDVSAIDIYEGNIYILDDELPALYVFPKVKVETQFSPCVSPHIFEAAGLKRLSVGMGLHKPTAPPHR